VFCANAGGAISTKVAQTTPAVVINSITDVLLTGFTITVTNDVAEQVTCGVYLASATAPTGAQLMAKTGSGDAAVGATNGPVVAPQAIAATANTPTPLMFSGLTSATDYHVFCANFGDAISTVFTQATPSVVTNSITDVMNNGFKITFTNDATEKVTCAVYLKTATDPTATEVNAKTGTNAAAVGAINGPVVAPQVVSATVNVAKMVTFTGLVSETDYKVFCANAGDSMSTAVTQKTSDSIVTDSITAVTLTGFTITVTNDDAEQVTCGVYLASATAPTGAEVNAKTGSGAAAVGTEEGPVVTEVVSAQANVAATLMVTGLKNSTDYQVFCANAGDSISTVVTQTTRSIQTDSITDVMNNGFKVTFTNDVTAMVTCAVYLKSATDPTATEVNAKTGTNAAAVGATNGPVVAPQAVSAASGMLTFSGLTSETDYKVFCANVGGGLSTVVTQKTSDAIVTNSVTDITHEGFKITVTNDVAEQVTCAVYLASATAPTGAEVNAKTGTNAAAVGATNGPVVAPGVVSAEANVAATVMVTGLKNSTDYKVFCANAGDSVSTGLTATTIVAVVVSVNNHEIITSVSLGGISKGDFGTEAQQAFKEVVASLLSICGATGTSQCTASDVTILSSLRRDVVVKFSVKTFSADTAKVGVDTISAKIGTTTTPVASFLTDLTAKAALKSITSTAVSTAPVATNSAPTSAPTNKEISAASSISKFSCVALFSYAVVFLS